MGCGSQYLLAPYVCFSINHCTEDSLTRRVGRSGRGFAGRDVPPIENDVQFGKIYIRIDGDDDELEKLREKLLASKATVRGDIVTKPWGLRDLTVQDADGVSDSSCETIPTFMLTLWKNVIVFNQMVKGYRTPANTIFEKPTGAQALYDGRTEK